MLEKLKGALSFAPKSADQIEIEIDRYRRDRVANGAEHASLAAERLRLLREEESDAAVDAIETQIRHCERRIARVDALIAQGTVDLSATEKAEAADREQRSRDDGEAAAAEFKRIVEGDYAKHAGKLGETMKRLAGLQARMDAANASLRAPRSDAPWISGEGFRMNPKADPMRIHELWNTPAPEPLLKAVRLPAVRQFEAPFYEPAEPFRYAGAWTPPAAEPAKAVEMPIAESPSVRVYELAAGAGK